MLSKVPGIKHPYLNIGRIEGGTDANVIPGKVVLKLDRRMIPEENPAEVEASIRAVIAKAMEAFNTEHGYQGDDAVRVQIKRLLLANAMTPWRAMRLWSMPSKSMAKPCSERSLRPWVLRCTPMCACMSSAAFPA